MGVGLKKEKNAQESEMMAKGKEKNRKPARGREMKTERRRGSRRCWIQRSLRNLVPFAFDRFLV